MTISISQDEMFFQNIPGMRKRLPDEINEIFTKLDEEEQDAQSEESVRKYGKEHKEFVQWENTGIALLVSIVAAAALSPVGWLAMTISAIVAGAGTKYFLEKNVEINEYDWRNYRIQLQYRNRIQRKIGALNKPLEKYSNGGRRCIRAAKGYFDSLLCRRKER